VRDNPVVGIEEGTLVRIEDDAATVLGTRRAKVFARGRAPRWVAPGQHLDI
jgi:hypothetical protein